jgi:sulfur transfer complex TusBCD TusB component (DsrH family)
MATLKELRESRALAQRDPALLAWQAGLTIAAKYKHFATEIDLIPLPKQAITYAEAAV